jgi:hypothetical protein
MGRVVMRGAMRKMRRLGGKTRSMVFGFRAVSGGRVLRGLGFRGGGVMLLLCGRCIAVRGACGDSDMILLVRTEVRKPGLCLGRCERQGRVSIERVIRYYLGTEMRSNREYQHGVACALEGNPLVYSPRVLFRSFSELSRR